MNPDKIILLISKSPKSKLNQIVDNKYTVIYVECSYQKTLRFIDY